MHHVAAGTLLGRLFRGLRSSSNNKPFANSHRLLRQGSQGQGRPPMCCRRGAKAAAGRPPIAPQRNKSGGGSGPGRSGSLGPPAASAVPAPSHALSRSASLPGPSGAAGSAAQDAPPAAQARRQAGSAKPEPAPGAGHSRSRPESAGSGSSAGGDSVGGQAQHAEQGSTSAAPLAPAPKLGKDDVLR